MDDILFVQDDDDFDRYMFSFENDLYPYEVDRRLFIFEEDALFNELYFRWQGVLIGWHQQTEERLL